MWGKECSKLVYAEREIYEENREDLERECTEDEFMAMCERYEVFDDLEERFSEMEEEVTGQVARYVDEHLEQFAEIVKDEE